VFKDEESSVNERHKVAILTMLRHNPPVTWEQLKKLGADGMHETMLELRVDGTVYCNSTTGQYSLKEEV